MRVGIAFIALRVNKIVASLYSPPFDKNNLRSILYDAVLVVILIEFIKLAREFYYKYDSNSFPNKTNRCVRVGFNYNL